MIKSNLAVVMARRSKKITEVSRATGLSRTTLTRLYYGKTRNLSFDTVGRLCGYLGCDVGELLEYTGKTTDRKEAGV